MTYVSHPQSSEYGIGGKPCCFLPQLSAVHHASMGGGALVQTVAHAQVAGMGNFVKQVYSSLYTLWMCITRVHFENTLYNNVLP